jgi:hypothetical protein
MGRGQALVDSCCKERGDVSQELSVGGFEQEPVVVAAAEARQWSGRRAEDLDGTFADRLVLASGVGKMLSGAARVGFGSRMNANRDQAREGRITNLLPADDLFAVELLVVVLRSEPNGRVLGLKSLQDDLAWRVGAPSTTGHLSEKLKRSL